MTAPIATGAAAKTASGASATAGSLLPDPIVADFLSRLAVPDLWAATKASAAWRRVAESAAETVWRRSLFNTYYRGNTFVARLPAGDIWPVDAPPAVLNKSSNWPWPDAAETATGAGGTEPVAQWTRMVFDREEGNEVPVDESEHAVAAAVAAAATAGAGTKRTGENLQENSRVRTMCEDFANKDIHRFFASAPTEAECDDKALAYLGWLCDAGRAGWKAFALRVHYACDPVVRRVRLKRTLLPHWKEEGGIATLQHNGGPPTDLDAAPTPREEANEIVQKRIENLRNLEQSGWRPCPGAIPMKTESHFGTPMYWKSFTSVLLVFNKGLSPAVAVLNRSEDYGEDDESISLSCRGYLGPHLGRRLDFSLSGRWTECTWNRFFTLMFLCNADRFSVATYGLDNTAMWKKSFDCAYMVESESSTINFAGLSF